LGYSTVKLKPSWFNSISIESDYKEIAIKLYLKNIDLDKEYLKMVMDLSPDLDLRDYGYSVSEILTLIFKIDSNDQKKSCLKIFEK